MAPTALFTCAMAASISAPRFDRAHLATSVTRLFALWQLPARDQLALLGLAPGNRAALARYRKGAPLAPQRDLEDRVGHLLAIHKDLRLLFPYDKELACAWMTRRNRAFDGRTPVETVRELGFVGFLMIRAYLDRVRGG